MRAAPHDLDKSRPQERRETMMLAVLILSLVTGSTPPPAMMPGFMDTSKLVAMCKADGPDAQAGQAICMGYVAGALDQLLAQQSRREGPRRTICVPNSMTVNDAVTAVVKYSRFAVTARGIGASSFIKFAMEDTYPCQVRGVGP
jgi:hypothetical protein